MTRRAVPVAPYARLFSISLQLNEDVRRHWRQQMIDAYTAGIILDRGHQLFYVVLTLDATEDDADSIAGAMRGRHGFGNAFPIIHRRSAGNG